MQGQLEHGVANMTARLIPEVGHWYAHRDKGAMFQVVAVDEDGGWVEIQDFDGDVDEVDLDAWFAMQIDHAEAPEDWTGPVDDVESDGPDDALSPGKTRLSLGTPLDDIASEMQDAIEAAEPDEEFDSRH